MIVGVAIMIVGYSNNFNLYIADGSTDASLMIHNWHMANGNMDN